ncbi:MAG: T9SS type A sorting domain-containing protein [Saprospiraceae bacterium]|nr:T9SS type A sorting domain-containing protein [Saprospiraceae bacterium]
MQQFDQVCRFHEHALPPDGPKKTQARDLFNMEQTIDVYEFQGGFYMLDASRTGMFDSRRSQIPNNPVGAVWTIDAKGNSPANDDFEAAHIFSPNNIWNNQKAVSAHYNAGKAYEYFLSKFNRNSINGQGGTIISFINVTEDDRSDMDNAFWHGTAMFYGNGNRAFNSPLAKSLDVAGHEISHGVVQNTANLEYFGESGALNESFADVFGVLIDRDDFKLGEDVVNPSIYRSGALRDMANPNNGGTSLSFPGYQPASVAQQYRGSEDNGGVHINSGIPNKAFHLIATAINKEKTEKIYYRALTNYLVRSSKFVDMRLAIVRAATDLHGANSAEVNAVNNAFNAVGIVVQSTGGGGGSGGGSSTTNICELETNQGTPFVLLTDAESSAIYSADEMGRLTSNPLLDIPILSKPSCTDNGSFCVFVGEDKTLYLINFQSNRFEQIENQAIWRNAAISKDGEKIALLTDEFNNEIIVFDFTSGQQQVFELYKPTTAQGVATGDVSYADVMEWDYDGEFLIYDAFNELKSSFGGSLNYWDISFLKAWNNQTNTFGDGLILSLFTGLPENVSVGNPTLSKNSPCIMTLDYFDDFEETYQIVGLNFETGDADVIIENNTLGFPSYTTTDDAIIFDFLNNGTAQILAYKELADNKISPKNNDLFLFVDGGSRGTWVTSGERTFTGTATLQSTDIKIFPTLTDDKVNIVSIATASPFVVKVYNSLGQLMLQTVAQTPNTSLSLADLPKGMYWIRLQREKELIYQAVVKE